MKFRALASAAALAILLATTACGTGNLANNAYGVNRAYDGNVRHGVTANRTAGSNTAGTTGRMTGTTSNARTNTRSTSRRLGNAAYNAGSGLGLGRNAENSSLTGTNTRRNTGIGRRANQTAASNAMRARGRYNRDGGYQMGTNSRRDGIGAGYNGRVDSTSDITNLRHTRANGAYSNSSNFENAIYRHQGERPMQANNLTPEINGVRNSGNQSIGGRTMVGIDGAGNQQNASALGNNNVNGRGNSTARNLANNSYLTNDINLMDGLNAGNGVVRNTNQTVQIRQNPANNTRRRNTAARNVRNNTANTRNINQTQDSVAR